MDWLEKKNPGLLQEKSQKKQEPTQIDLPESLRNDLKPIVARGIQNIFSELLLIPTMPEISWGV